MRLTNKNKSFYLIDLCIVAAPLVAALFLTFLIASQTNGCLTDCFLNGDQFIVMPRNCYLKIL